MNKKRFLILLYILTSSYLSFSQKKVVKTDVPINTKVSEIDTVGISKVCISEEEMKLYKLLMAHRKEKKLDSIPLSKSLCFVAMNHTLDLVMNKPETKDCNMHSWSNKGSWKPCCYYSDHRNAGCMWDKPFQLTNYKTNGYEIAFNNSAGADANSAFNGWLHSSGHHAVIINDGIWKSSKWKAIGISIYKNYAVVWFGDEKDAAGIPKICGK